jgi:hypothetical protein
MSDRDRAHTEGERGRAVARLQAAVSRRSGLRHAHESAKGTRSDVTADAALRTADDEVAAREQWLKSVDDHEY